MKSVAAFLLAAALAGCGRAPSPAYAVPYPDANRRGVSPKNLDLLYVAERDGTVAVYTFSQRTFVRALTGFTNPQGECVDKDNNVYVTDSGTDDIVEFAHDGAKPLRTINDAPYSPVGCAIDFTTGNLAVANKTPKTYSGNIAIYTKASGSPTILYDSAFSGFGTCVYDNRGNLLAADSGRYTGDDQYFAWLPAKGKRFVNIKVPGATIGSYWEGVQGLQWDGLFYVIELYNRLARITVQNGEAYYIGSTELGEENVLGPGWIYDASRKKQGTQYVGISLDFNRSRYDGVEYFAYPQGGEGALFDGLGPPNALTISLGKIHE